MAHEQLPPTPVPFGEAEIQHFQRDDVEATRVVAGLMTVIFVIGLVLYAAIAYLVGP